MRLNLNEPAYGSLSLRQPARRRTGLSQMQLSEVQVLTSRAGIYLLCFFDNAQHSFGTLMYVAILGLAVFGLTRDSATLFRGFVPLWAVSIFYILLSFAHALPPAWTLFYRPSAILSQVHWLLGLPLIASLVASYVSNVLRYHCRREFIVVSFLLLVNFIASGFLSADHYSIFSYGPFGYLWAPMSVYLVIVAWGVQIQRDSKIFLFFLLQAGIAILLASGSQTKIAYAVVASALLLRRAHSIAGSVLLISVIAFVFGGYYYTLNNVYEVYQHSPDVGIRALMVKNAFNAAQETNFIGVGFGTESLKNEYQEIDLQSFNWINDAFILIGVHNAFADVLMKMGIIGLLSLLVAIYHLDKPFGGKQNTQSSFRKLMLAITILNLSVNVGLQSPFHMAGAGAMLGAAFVTRARKAGALTKAKDPQNTRAARVYNFGADRLHELADS